MLIWVLECMLCVWLILFCFKNTSQYKMALMSLLLDETVNGTSHVKVINMLLSKIQIQILKAFKTLN